MAKVMIAVFDRTLHIEDSANHMPFEYAIDGTIIQGHKASRSIPPCTPVELDADEADRILAHTRGVRIPVDVPDPRQWLRDHGRELGISMSLMDTLAHG